MTERNPNRNDESGKYTQGFSPEQALDALIDLGGAATTSEVADEMGCVRRTAYNKLRALEDDGRIRSREAGRTRLWLTRNDIAASGVSDAGERSKPADGDSMAGVEEGSPGAHPRGDAPGTGLQDAEPGDAVPAFLDAPAGIDREEALEAVDAVRQHLRENGPASKRELVLAVMPDHPLGYDVPELETGDRYRGSWWRKVIHPALEAVDDVEYRDNYSDYRYTGDEEV